MIGSGEGDLDGWMIGSGPGQRSLGNVRHTV